MHVKVTAGLGRIHFLSLPNCKNLGQACIFLGFDLLILPSMQFCRWEVYQIAAVTAEDTPILGMPESFSSPTPSQEADREISELMFVKYFRFLG